MNATEMLAAITKIKEEMDRPVPVKGYTSKQYLEILGRLIPAGDCIGRFHGLPIYVDDGLPPHVVMRFVDKDGNVLSEMHASGGGDADQTGK